MLDDESPFFFFIVLVGSIKLGERDQQFIPYSTGSIDSVYCPSRNRSRRYNLTKQRLSFGTSVQYRPFIVMASSSTTTSSTQRARPQSANPSRRTRTASSIHHHHHHHHKSADLEEHPPSAPAGTPEEDLNRPITNQVVVPNVNKLSSPPPYDSLVTFECIQKASALRVLAKTLDRQRDVSSINQNSSESSDVEQHHRSSTAQPRKLRPLAREFSGPL